MRKAQKQNLLDCITSLQQAHDEIRQALRKKDTSRAQNMLAECQNFAISLGETIEKSEGEGFVTVSFLEEYCELCYRLHEELGSGVFSESALYKGLQKQLYKIEKSVKDDIPVKKEIAFFPYKASMWDSLESVFLAAQADQTCDAYCVPIPYYERNADQSFGAMHYEGFEYPANIPVTDWQTYNFEERRPDVIYIHNPYDDWNFVTSVHPRFYASNLKKYTDKLVYIPYFVLGEIEPNDQAAIDGMKHFITTPGVMYADEVIVQSEKMKQIYVNEWLKYAKEQRLSGKYTDRAYQEQRIKGTGSPKIEKVLRMKKEDVAVPQDWQKILTKPDGSRKKIIFYNISVSTLLQYNDKWLDKLEDVLRIFKENKDDIALLWRPHPLVESTLKSMRPDLLECYERIKKNYQTEGWGIYDDSADMDRAVVLSDAYYGDWSSVVQLYRETKKPIMIQNCDIEVSEEWENRG